MPYGEWTGIASDIRVRPRRAGHILGSAILEMALPARRGERAVVFSGDLGRYGAPLLPDPTPIAEADYLLVESTYGDRRHPAEPAEDQLAGAIARAAERGGVLLIPAFAVGRTQDVLYLLWRLEESGRIPRTEVYLDSPMAINATDLYCAHPEEFDGETQADMRAGRCALAGHSFHTATTPEASRALNAVTGPGIIISASGMVTGGRILHHMKLRLPDPRSTVLFVGYQAAGTRGRSIRDGAEAVKMFGAWVPVRAHVEAIDGLSAHADADGIQRWLGGFQRPPRRTFIVHGEPQPARALQAAIAARRHWDARVPADGERVTLAWRCRGGRWASERRPRSGPCMVLFGVECGGHVPVPVTPGTSGNRRRRDAAKRRPSFRVLRWFPMELAITGVLAPGLPIYRRGTIY